MKPEELAKAVVDRMMSQDWFSQWLGIEVLNTGPGTCTLRVVVRKEMLNGFGIAHGGITYSVSDSALAFASNSHGKMAVSVETSISHLAAVKEGDTLTAVAIEKSLSHKIGVYEVVVTNQSNATVALFKGTVYRKSQDWF
ncbi:MAG TPA: hotdog fold thioesterase [Bacteroidia bacterium]|nr:hotdog fold thioesterase [Bacteroidia bacterium]